MLILQFVIFVFCETDETDRIGLIRRQFQRDGRKAAGESFDICRFFNVVAVIAVIRLNILLVQIRYAAGLLRRFFMVDRSE